MPIEDREQLLCCFGGSKILGIDINDWSALEQVVLQGLPYKSSKYLFEQICLRNKQEFDRDPILLG